MSKPRDGAQLDRVQMMRLATLDVVRALPLDPDDAYEVLAQARTLYEHYVLRGEVPKPLARLRSV